VRAHAPHRARHETASLGLLSEPGHQSREAAALGRVAAHYYSFFSFLNSFTRLNIQKSSETSKIHVNS
jgi:hypothetical protein